MDTGKTVNSNNSHSHDGDGLVVKSQLEPLTISANSNNIGGGPPTPTHSENQDGIDIRKGEYPITPLPFVLGILYYAFEEYTTLLVHITVIPFQ